MRSQEEKHFTERVIRSKDECYTSLESERDGDLIRAPLKHQVPHRSNLLTSVRIACGGQELRATTGWPRIYSETVLFVFFAVDELEELSSLWIFNRSRSLLI